MTEITKETALKIKSLRELLQEEYLLRSSKNPSYSLRAFAISMGINDSTLSQYLRGKRALSKKDIKKVFLYLNIELGELQKMLIADEIKKSNNAELIPHKLYEQMTHWIYDAILELTHLDDFKSDYQFISDRLAIPISQVKFYVDKLKSSSLLKITDDKWVDQFELASTLPSEDFDELAFQKYQVSLAEKSKASIINDTAEEKSHTSYITVIDTELIPEIKEEIKKFRRKLINKINKKSKKKNGLYGLQISLMPLIENEFKDKGETK